MSNPCADKGLDYDCNLPTPRTGFFEGPVCDPVGQWLYDPANCDAGYWCGCSSILVEECIPTNDVGTHWIGHFTTVNKTTGETIVLEGSRPHINRAFNRSMDLWCPDGYYCPGRNEVERCVDLCPPKSFCESPAEYRECPKDRYCPVATTEPLKCTGLQNCTAEGARRFSYVYGMAVIIIALFIAVYHLFLARMMLQKRERKVKAEKAEKARQAKLAHKGEDDTEHTHHEVAPPESCCALRSKSCMHVIKNSRGNVFLSK
jgi:hypothetical protein